MEKLKTIADYLDKQLKIADYEDSSNNGLQVENVGRIDRICCGVDASLEFYEAAIKKGANLLVCHHGLSWGDSLKRITDLNYRHLSFLIENNIALYVAHLPLDAHNRYGNNILICRALGLGGVKKFGLYNGSYIGFEGKLAKPMAYDKFKKLVKKVTGGELRTMDFGKKTVKTVAVVSGAAAGEIVEVGQKGIDVYVSGEAKLSAYNLAREYGVNVIFAGHYATEVFGVRALSEMLGKKFKVKSEFIDLGIEY